MAMAKVQVGSLLLLASVLEPSRDVSQTSDEVSEVAESKQNYNADLEHTTITAPSLSHLWRRRICPAATGASRVQKPSSLFSILQDCDCPWSTETCEDLLAMSHYEILGLDPRDVHTLADIKLAYRQTLLTHHPDKIKLESTVRSHVARSASSKSLSGTVPSVDAIVSAFHVLSNPSTRAEYDSVLQTKHKNAVLHRKSYDHAGLDSFDLEDLVFEEDTTAQCSWYKGCRCGRERGFVVTEKDLEEASGEDDKTTRYSASRSILVECTGCSLLIRITFAVEPG